METLVTASILSADLGHLQDEVDSLKGIADWIQVDVMDGHFVPNLTFGAPMLKCIRTQLPVDIHLMVSNPADRVQEFLDVGATNITFHAEAVLNSGERRHLIKRIHDEGATAGIAINPETQVDDIDDVVGDVDLVLVMSVVPGFSGQTFIEDVLPKVRHLREHHPNLMIQMDGGIDDRTAMLCREAGANNLVSANYLLRFENKKAAADVLRGA